MTKNSYSQFSEDLFLANIFKQKNINKGFFLEFGAWDGKHLSNCRHLYENGWKGCFIEGNKSRFLDLKKNYIQDNDVILLNIFVDQDRNTLDDILLKNSISELDLLSIDIDGKDLLILKTLTKIKPKVIVIEFNQNIPFDVIYEDNTEESIGSSFLAIKNYANKIGYQLIHATMSNLIFINREFNKNFFLEMDKEQAFALLKPTRIAFNYLGEMIFFKGYQLERKEYFRFPSKKSFITFQPIPKFLRKLTDVNGNGYKLLNILYSNFIFLLLRPNLFIQRIIKKILKKDS
jgi:hypothetical protein